MVNLPAHAVRVRQRQIISVPPDHVNLLSAVVVAPVVMWVTHLHYPHMHRLGWPQKIGAASDYSGIDADARHYRT